MRTYGPISVLTLAPPTGGWPTQARFWLEWGCSDLSNSVIPTGADHREETICGVDGPFALFLCERVKAPHFKVAVSTHARRSSSIASIRGTSHASSA